MSPRKIPILFKLFEKAGGDVLQSTSKNYNKDPRHLVLLKGFQLKELQQRPASPSTNPQQPTAEIPHNNPIMPVNENNVSVNVNVGMNQIRPGMPNQQGIRPPNMLMNQNQMNQNQMNPQQQNNYGQQNPGMVPGYNQQINRPQGQGNTRWMMPPAQRAPFLQQNPNMMQQQQNQPAPSALISQLSTPPNIVGLSAQQQQVFRMQQQQQQQVSLN